MSREKFLHFRDLLLETRQDILGRVKNLESRWQEMSEPAIELEEEAQMAAVFGGQEPDALVFRNGRMAIHLKRYIGIVSGLNQERGNADSIQEIHGRLSGVIMHCA